MTESMICVNNILDETVWDATRQLVVGPRRNLEEMVEEPDLADSLFLGGQRGLKQWTVSQKKVTKDYGDIMAGVIYSMVQTSDKKYLFVSDYEGY
jgi:WD40 repeat protein